jgi:hypothetical protein
MYIPPANNAINFDLRSYTSPSINSINFELGGVVVTFGKVCVSGVWYDVIEAYVTIGEDWKTVNQIQFVLSGAWRVGE